MSCPAKAGHPVTTGFEAGTAQCHSPCSGISWCIQITGGPQSPFFYLYAVPFLVQAFQMARSLDYVAGMLMWNLNFQLAVPQTNEEWGFGIIRSDGSGRPAYAALTEMSKS